MRCEFWSFRISHSPFCIAVIPHFFGRFYFQRLKVEEPVLSGVEGMKAESAR